MIKKALWIGIMAWIGVGCAQERLIPADVENETPQEEALSAGTMDVSRVVFIGDGWMAGMQNGTLYEKGQEASLGRIIYNSMGSLVRLPLAQPDIGSKTGYLAAFSDPENNIYRGYLRLTFSGADPVISDAAAFPAPPSINPMFTFQGPLSALRNFAIPNVWLQDIFLSGLGDWQRYNTDQRFNPYYARFARTPAGTVLSDILATKPTFFFLWMGMDEVLNQATMGKGEKNTQTAADYEKLLTMLMNQSPTLKGMIGNIPNVLESIPFFNFYNYNIARLDMQEAQTLTTHYQTHVTQVKNLPNEVKQRLGEKYNDLLLEFEAGNNPLIIHDDALEPILRPHGIEPWRKARENDIILLSAGIFLNNNPTPLTEKQGFGRPLEDIYVLTHEERLQIESLIDQFNASVANVLQLYPDRLALVDVASHVEDLAKNGPLVIDNVAIHATFLPIPLPIDAYSVDGIHPNSRGYAYIAKCFVEHTEKAYEAQLSLPLLGNYTSNLLPPVP